MINFACLWTMGGNSQIRGEHANMQTPHINLPDRPTYRWNPGPSWSGAAVLPHLNLRRPAYGRYGDSSKLLHHSKAKMFVFALNQIFRLIQVHV